MKWSHRNGHISHCNKIFQPPHVHSCAYLHTHRHATHITWKDLSFAVDALVWNLVPTENSSWLFKLQMWTMHAVGSYELLTEVLVLAHAEITQWFSCAQGLLTALSCLSRCPQRSAFHQVLTRGTWRLPGSTGLLKLLTVTGPSSVSCPCHRPPCELSQVPFCRCILMHRRCLKKEMVFKIIFFHQAWWHLPIIPKYGRLRQRITMNSRPSWVT